MHLTLREVAGIVEGELHGDGDLEVWGVAAIDEAQAGQVTFLADRKRKRHLDACAASAVLVGRDVDLERPYIRTEDPYFAFTHLVAVFHPPAPLTDVGVSDRAWLGPGVRLGPRVTVFPFSSIDAGTEIGEGTVIYSGSSIGRSCRIGRESIIHANCSLYDGTVVGDRVVIHAGSVLGSDGFGYLRRPEGRHHKIPQVGHVEIGDDVEIGAGVCIDRGTLGVTRIGEGTKIDNLVHVGHNTVIGPGSLLLAQVGVSGSCRIGPNVTLAGQVGMVDHIEVGENTVVGAQSGLPQSLPPNGIFMGSPALEHRLWRRVQALVPTLPDLAKRLRHLEKAVETLRQKVLID